MDEEEIIKRLNIQNHDFRVVLGRTGIDYDLDKEEENRRKHGYSLESAVDLLQRHILPINTTPFMTSEPFMENGEVRHMHMGVDDRGLVVFMVTTMRKDETVRVFSFRRASEKEREVFKNHTGYKESVL